MTIFVEPKTKIPLTFHVVKQKRKKELENLIQSNGGLVIPTLTDHGKKTFFVIIIGCKESPASFSSFSSSNIVLLPDFVYESVKEGKVVNMNNYRLSNTPISSQRGRLPRGRNFYTQEDDELLERLVREELLRTGTKLLCVDPDFIKSIQCQFPSRTLDSLTLRYKWLLSNSRTIKSGSVDEAFVSSNKPSPVDIARYELKEEKIKLDHSNDEAENIDLSQVPRTQKFSYSELSQMPLTQAPLINSVDKGSSQVEFKERDGGCCIGDFGIQIEMSRQILLYLTERFTLPSSVIIHALYVNSGCVDDTIKYLEDECVRPPWTVNEDYSILANDQDKINEIINKKGDQAVQVRKRFLVQVCSRPLENF